jgi:predicted enzyme related to lactoylglutathione lyase
MGHPVVHFEVIGKDGDKLRSYYSSLFDWQFDTSNPMDYGVVDRADNLTDEGVGIGGGVATGPADYRGHVTFYVQVPDVEATLAKAVELGGTRTMGPETVMGRMVLGMLTDPEGHTIGVIQAP